MAKRKPPKVTFIHHMVEPPKYSLEELEGLKEQALRLAKHIEILKEEVKSKSDQLVGLESIIQENSPKL
jgi:hypothetical protein